MTPLAHGVGSVQDLPVPQWLFLYGAGIVLVVSFAALALLWRRPVLEDYRGGRALPGRLSRVPALARRCGSRSALLGFALLVLVFATALVGERSAGSNIAPTFVYVGFWLGLVVLVVLLGNVWSALNPWKADRRLRRVGRRPRRCARRSRYAYPERLGRWPAAVGLFLFAALELAYYDPADPRSSRSRSRSTAACTWIGALVYGSAARGSRAADAFTVYFGLLARIAPVAVGRTDACVLRPPFVGLARLRRPDPGTLAFVAVDARLGRLRRLQPDDRLAEPTIELGDIAGTLARAAGLLGCGAPGRGPLPARGRTSRGAAARTDLPLAGAFVASLVPIALVYAVSHYFSLLVVQGQFLFPLASDPFGYGWDLFGTLDYRPNVAPFSPNAVWYVQVATLVAGHVAGLALAHDRALALFRGEPGRALRTQYPFLVLMVAYTVGGLWLLSLD